MAPLPSPRYPTKAFLELTDLQSSAVLSGPVEPLDDALAAGPVIAVGRRKRGADLPGTVAVQADGTGLFTPNSGADPFPQTLAAPAQLLCNIVEAISGETVYNEVLGSSDGANPNQAYPLKRSRLLGRKILPVPTADGRIWKWRWTVSSGTASKRYWKPFPTPASTLSVSSRTRRKRSFSVTGSTAKSPHPATRISLPTGTVTAPAAPNRRPVHPATEETGHRSVTGP